MQMWYKVLVNREKGAGKQGINYHSIDMRSVAPIYKGGRPYISGRSVLYMRATAILRFLPIQKQVQNGESCLEDSNILNYNTLSLSIGAQLH